MRYGLMVGLLWIALGSGVAWAQDAGDQGQKPAEQAEPTGAENDQQPAGEKQAAQEAAGKQAPAKKKTAKPKAAEKKPDKQEAADAQPADNQAADEPDAQDQAKAEKPRLRVKAEHFTFIPASVQLNSYAHFDDEGNVRSHRQSFSLGIKAKYKGPGQPRGYEDLRIDPIRTNLGQMLKPNIRDHQRSSSGSFSQIFRNQRNDAKDISLSFEVDFPRPNTTHLAQITGSIDIVFNDGPTQFAVIPNLKKAMGKSIRLARIEDSSIRFEEQGQHLRMWVSNEAAACITAVRFEDARGRSIDVDYRGSGSSNGRAYVYLDGDTPRDARVILSVQPETQRVTVPIEVRNVPMPHAEGEAVDLVINLRDAVPIIAAEAAGDSQEEKKFEGDLELIIE